MGTETLEDVAATMRNIRALGAFLREREQRYGGLHRVKRGTVSPHDPRSAADIARGSMTGGDRMTEHGYAETYAREFIAFLGEEGMRREITADLLRELEQKFSGGKIERGIPWGSMSPDDPRPPEEIARGGHDGHRMQPRDVRGRNYAETYARELSLLNGQGLTIVELGILRGIGLAIWCDLFPRARVIGLDVDESNFLHNVLNLESRGAFKENGPEVFYFDELDITNARHIPEILRGDRLPFCANGKHERIGARKNTPKIHIFIDDALHLDDPIMKSFADFLPFMADHFLYFIEDNRRVWKKLKAKYPDLNVRYFDELTVVSR